MKPAANSSDAATALPTAITSGPWQVRLLGGFGLSRQGVQAPRLRSRAAMLLVARLAMAPGRDHPREELCELLWPGTAIDQSRNRLRQTLSLLRDVLEPAGAPATLLADRRVLRVVPGALLSDTQAFEQAVAKGQDATALACYAGELLPGFYDDWVHTERLRLAGLAERLPQSLAPASAPPVVAQWAAATGPAPGSQLPSYWTPAFGLLPSVQRLQSLVARERLVTVHGPGGSGKTRLAVSTVCALQAALPARFVRMVYVPLLACQTQAQAVDAVCRVLQAEATADLLGGQQARLLAALDGGAVLLVLDNTEQLVAQGLGHLVTGWLSALPELHVLVTSRLVLDVDGETVFTLAGLDLPAEPAAGWAQDAAFESALDAATLATPALALFVSRAGAARPGFELSGGAQAQAAVALVRLLAGMPLALELAASRLRTLSVTTLLHNLQSGMNSPMLQMLARARSGPVTAAASGLSEQARHASMRNTLAYSFDLLSRPELGLLQTLALAAAAVRLEAVAALAGAAPAATQLLLDALVAASLVQAAECADGCVRYAMLQPVRECAAETVAPGQADEQARAARNRLRVWLAGFTQAAMQQGPTVIAPDAYVLDLALTSAPADGALPQALQLALSARAYWNTALPSAAAVQALELSLQETPTPAPQGLASQADALPADTQVLAHELLAFVCLMQGNTAAAVRHADHAVALPAGDRARSLALARWCWVRYGAGQLDSDFDSALNEGAALARRCGDLRAQGRVLFMQSVIASDLRLQWALAERLVAERQAIWAQLGDRAAVTAALLNRAVLWAHQGRHEDSVAAALECESLLRNAANPAGYAFALIQLARIYLMARRWQEAQAAFCSSLRVCAQHHLQQYQARALLHLPNALAVGESPVTAARLHGFATAFYRRHFGPWNRIEARELCRTRRLLRHRLGASGLQPTWLKVPA